MLGSGAAKELLHRAIAVLLLGLGFTLWTIYEYYNSQVNYDLTDTLTRLGIISVFVLFAISCLAWYPFVRKRFPVKLTKEFVEGWFRVDGNSWQYSHVKLRWDSIVDYKVADRQQFELELVDGQKVKANYWALPRDEIHLLEKACYLYCQRP